uniref:Uncharacterized protein n=1 Tax=Arundo donax TaxID=35708 RepID=A0A0A8Y7J7_ARUDO
MWHHNCHSLTCFLSGLIHIRWFDTHKVPEEVCKSSSARFLLPLLYWVEHKQWPPPLHAEGVTDQSTMISVQGPLFESEQGGIQPKTPWPSVCRESELHHDSKISDGVISILCTCLSDCKLYTENAMELENSGEMLLSLLLTTPSEAVAIHTLAQSVEAIHYSACAQYLRLEFAHLGKHRSASVTLPTEIFWLCEERSEPETIMLNSIDLLFKDTDKEEQFILLNGTTKEAAVLVTAKHSMVIIYEIQPLLKNKKISEISVPCITILLELCGSGRYQI